MVIQIEPEITWIFGLNITWKPTGTTPQFILPKISRPWGQPQPQFCPLIPECSSQSCPRIKAGLPHTKRGEETLPPPSVLPKIICWAPLDCPQCIHSALKIPGLALIVLPPAHKGGIHVSNDIFWCLDTTKQVFFQGRTQLQVALVLSDSLCPLPWCFCTDFTKLWLQLLTCG